MPKYLPSAFLNEIEPALRRKFRTRKEPPMWLIALVAIAVIVLTFLVVGKMVDDQARAAEVSREITYSSLCEQYRSDAQLAGFTVKEETINLICS